MQRFLFIGANSDMAIAAATYFKQQGIEVIGLSRTECSNEYAQSFQISGLSETDFPQLD